ncbi:MAG: UDP-3-O-(3-hydroxymyristoyl)glucosamine N-acyltransferase [Candidatus Eremiobacteraeota bacterium]|nr:UDP-3-O-(3-hydroxymyristoyl)glucosamine N-acyltransferase [Candidatus Eremiobacteraeota bacterium]
MPKTLAEFAAMVGGRVVGDASLQIERVAAIEDATGNALTFATDEKYLKDAVVSGAAAVLTDAKLARDEAQSVKPLLLVDDVRSALAKVLHDFERPIPRGHFRHPSAVIESSATIGDDVFIGAHVYVGEGASIGANSTLLPGVVVGADVQLGSHCILHPHAMVLDGSRLGNRVVIHSGAVVGSAGFGWAFANGRLERIPQVGNVVLGDEVEIGANACVDRAQTGSTTIGRGTKIDNLCQIGHNCRIGEHSVLAGQCGLAGSTTIGDHVQAGGQVGFIGHLRVGSRVKIGGGSVVWGDIPDDAFISGRPARPHKDELRREVMVRKLPKLFARVDALERKLSR